MLRRNLIVLLLAGAAAVILISLGCDDLVTQTIKTDVRLDPTAEFVATPDSGCAPMLVAFNETSSGLIKTWIWNFGDGTKHDTIFKLTEDGNGDVSHTYDSTGSFTVVLTVIDSLNGIDPESKKRAVIVGQNLDSVKLSDTLVCPGEEITFKAFDPYGVATWRWEFGDGTVVTDDSVVQTHAYGAAGLYQFKLTVTGNCGAKVMIDTVHVLNCARPYFTADPDNGCVTFSVAFTDSSTPPIDSSGDNYDTVGAIVNWAWNFGNGQSQEYDQPSNTIDIEYGNAGSYPVRLTVTTDSGGVTSYTDTITAYPTASADFTAQPTAACQVPGRQFLVAFTRAPTGDTAWIWDFGDDDTSHAQNPYHAYENPGYYTVRLDVLGACGEDITTIEKIDFIRFADQLEPVSFTYQVADSNWRTLTFVDQSGEDTVFTRFWTIPGVGVTGLDTVVHTFDSAGTYIVRLTRYNDCDSLWMIDTLDVDSVTP